MHTGMHACQLLSLARALAGLFSSAAFALVHAYGPDSVYGVLRSPLQYLPSVLLLLLASAHRAGAASAPVIGALWRALSKQSTQSTHAACTQARCRQGALGANWLLAVQLTM